ncbi:MAG: hypothetical protein ACRD1X_04075 [Vicinamibacteria bacterium]
MATKVRTGDVRVEGLAELSRVLKRMDSDLAKELRKANKDAAQVAATVSKSRALSVGGVAAKVAPTIRASAGVKSASVGFGGAQAPMAGGAEFGANRDRLRQRSTGTYVGYRQFQPWRGSGRNAGYFVYPAIRDNENRIVEQYTDALDHLLRRTFPD